MKTIEIIQTKDWYLAPDEQNRNKCLIAHSYTEPVRLQAAVGVSWRRPTEALDREGRCVGSLDHVDPPPLPGQRPCKTY